MAQDLRDSKRFYFDDDATDNILKGAEIMYKAVSTTYGPRGRNVLIGKPYGRPVITRDGVTVSRDTYLDQDEVNEPMQLLLEASQTTNRVAGDGTTATVCLTYHLMRYAFQRVAAGINPMQVRDEILADALVLRDELKTISTKVKKGQLEQVATVSSGDPLLGKLIAEAVEHVGPDGGIITEKAPISGVDREYVDGYYMQQGFTAIETGKKTVETPYVVVCSKPIGAGVDALELVQKVINKAYRDKGLVDGNGNPLLQQPLGEPLRIAFFGEVEGDAYNTIIANIQKGVFDGVVIKTPPMGDMGVQYLEDLAIYTGGKSIKAAQTIASVDDSYIGRADKVTSTTLDTVIFGGQHSDEDLSARLAEIKDRLSTEEIDAIAEKLRDRISKLENKIAKFRIGGATETEKEEKEFRIEDAIQSTRAAAAYGVVAGGATTLVQLSRNSDIQPLFSKALEACFLKLMENAALPGEVKLHEINQAPINYGFNLRGDTSKPVDMIKAGILDPTLVVDQILENAASNAALAVTLGLIITIKRKKEA